MNPFLARAEWKVDVERGVFDFSSMNSSRIPRLPRRGRSRAVACVSVILLLLLVGASVDRWILRAPPGPDGAVKQMKELARPERAVPFGEERGERVVSGVVRGPEGRPVPGAEWKLHVSSPPTEKRQTGVTGNDGAFETVVMEGRLTLTVEHGGHAPSVVLLKDGEASAGLEIALDHGIDFAVRCVDDEGNALVGAAVEMRLVSNYDSFTIHADKEGHARFEHLPANAYVTIIASHSGFKTTRVDGFPLVPSTSPYSVTLQPEAAVRVRFVDGESGEPLEGVRTRIANPRDGRATTTWSRAGRTSDAGGEVLLDELDGATVYTMHGQWKERSVRFSLDPAETKEMTVEMPVPRTLHVFIENVTGIESIDPVQYRHPDSVTRRARPEIIDNRIEMTLENLRPEEVSLLINGQWVRVPPLLDPVTEFHIDYDEIRPPDDVEVLLTFDTDRGWAPPEGELFIDSRWRRTQQVKIEEGRAVFSIPGGTSFRVRPHNVVGGLIGGIEEELIATGDPAEITLPVVPAGMVRVKVLDHRGRLAESVFARARERGSDRTFDIKVMRSWGQDTSEWYVSEPLPLGRARRFEISASSNLVDASTTVSLNRRNPIRDVVLRLQEPEVKKIHFSDTEDRPLANISVWATLPESNSRPRLSARVNTDADGMATILMAPNEKRTLTVFPETDTLVPGKIELDPGQEEPRVRFMRGRTFRGRIESADPDASVSGQMVFWHTPDGSLQSRHLWIEPNGSFEFRDLPDRPVTLSIGRLPGQRIEGDLEIQPDATSRVFYVKSASH